MTNQDLAVPFASAEPGNRVKLVAQAVKVWTGELVDLGGRNTLLYYRDLKQGTLDLGPRTDAYSVAVDDLLSSRPTRLSNLFGAISIGPAARRARTIKAKATENLEERGLETLFLAWGMASWTNPRGTATPAAPILLTQAVLSARGGAGEDFDVSLPYEWTINPTLLHLLKTEFEVELNADELLEVLDDGADPPDSTRLFNRVCKAASEVPGFEVTPRVILGNFSYAKLPMVLDLETATDTLVDSDLICAIAGDELSRDAVRARHITVRLNEPDLIPPSDEFLVLDADASQSYAINAVVAGADLVVDGPPGTGKSQTIANLIATLSARGKRTLFVAEKRAAIDAVKDRLNRVGLGELILDLHEGAGPKRRLAADLARTLSAVATLPKPEVAAAQETLVRHRALLVARDEALHEPRHPWGVSVYQAQAALLGIPAVATSVQRLTGDALKNLNGAAFGAAKADLEALIGLGGLRLARDASPWAGAYAAGTITTAASAQSGLNALSTLANHTLPEATERFEHAVAECGLALPKTVRDWTTMLRFLDDVAATLSVLDPAVFDLPLEDLATELAPSTRGTFSRLGARISRGDYREARKTVLTLWIGERKPKPAVLYQAVVAAAQQWAIWRRGAVAPGRPHLPSDMASTRGACGQFSNELEALMYLVDSADLPDQSLVRLTERLELLLADTETLAKLPELVRLRTQLERAGLGALLREIAERNLTVDRALACLEHVWLTSVLETVSIGDSRIGAFNGAAQHRTVLSYRGADRAHIDSAPLRIRRAVAENATKARDEYPKENEVIQHQARLKRGHLPTRQLFQVAPHVLGALKPCWAMSPLVVSQLLPAQRLFDVVIFDEASQVTPADAVGALMRAEQAVVAGDPHQLPPTSFFLMSAGGEDDEEAEEEALGSVAGTRNMESILDVMGALLPPPKGTRTLSWHYRSKDERLIAFSNAQPNLYDWALTTFPGIDAVGCLSHVLVPFVPGRVDQTDSVSDEVTAVVRLVSEHAKSRPDQSLGVIAMGIKHANRIDEGLRRARKNDEALDAFLGGAASAQSAKEPFFIKNLERVQGDERDAIILTVGYGKSPDGRMIYRFGPINNEGGERRLNVAITRARASMTVVSSFSVTDMDPAHLRSEGAQMLCRYLAYAESGGTDLGNVSKDKPDLNPFERDVQAKLTEAGVPLVAQYGCSGYWIDFAAQHPTLPGQMVLAVECDGATYHSSATARDRDRLRQEHLERLGWCFHRLWSQDWFFHRELEIERAVAAYHAAVAAFDAGSAGYRRPALTPLDIDDSLEVTRDPKADFSGSTERGGLCPVRGGRGSIDEYSESEIVAVVRWIESDTLLRTEQELLLEVMHQLGFHRRGSKIESAITAAITQARDPQWKPVRQRMRPPPAPRPPRSPYPPQRRRRYW